jgi:hypothetical protein
MHSGAAPLPEQIAILLLGPPIGTWIWWILSRGWAKGVQGGSVSERTKRRQKIEFWIILTFTYIMFLGIFIYAWVT